MFKVYILFSTKLDKYYIGSTDDVPKRLEEHNNVKYKNAYTKNGGECELKMFFSCDLSKDAYFMERYIKRMKSRKFIEKIILDPNIFYQIRREKSCGFNPE